MKKKIILRSAIVIFVAVFVSMCIGIFSQYRNNVKDLNNQMKSIVVNLSQDIDNVSKKYKPMSRGYIEDVESKINYVKHLEDRYRITWISDDGKVLYDTDSNYKKMENHKSREEVSEALNGKIGMSMRYSRTLSKEYRYYAYKATDSVIRVSTSASSPFQVILKNSILVILITIIASLISILAFSSVLKKSFKVVQDLAINLRDDIVSGKSPDNIQADNELKPLVDIINIQRIELSYYLNSLQDRITITNEILNNMSEGLIILDNDNNIVRINKSAINLLELESPRENTDKNNDSIGAEGVLNKLQENTAIKDKKQDKEQDKELDNAVILEGKANEILENKKKVENYIGKNIFNLNLDQTLYTSIFENEKNIISIKRQEKYLNIFISPSKDSKQSIDGKIVFVVDNTKKYMEEMYRREFTANVSHELKTPLTSINGYAEMIAAGFAGEDDIKNFANTILSQGRKLLGLIDDIIKLSKLDEENSMSLPKEKVNVYDVAKNIIYTIEPVANKKDVEIDLESNGEVVIDTVPYMMEEILYNIIANAVSYNKVNGKVKVLLIDNEENIKISVKDTGIGISKEDIPRVFERFYRCDKSRSKNDFNSTGLGLAIVKHIVLMLDGKINIESELGKGTEISIYLKK